MRYTYVIATVGYRRWMQDARGIARFLENLGNELNLEDGMPFALQEGFGFQFKHGHLLLRSHERALQFEISTTKRLDYARLVRLLKRWAPVYQHSKVKLEHPLIAVTKNKGEKDDEKKQRKETKRSISET